MPWKETTTMEQKVEFICEWLSGNYTITELCNEFRISRPTAYRLINRYEKMGIEGLLEQSTRPSNHPNKTKKEIIDKIISLKDKHKKWGAKKLRILLFNDFISEDIPSVVTVHNILSKNGLVCPQRRLRRVKPLYPIFDPKECNEVWSADYKGKFRMGNKKYCHPLTIADSKSRFVFTAKAHSREDFKSAKAEFTRVFRKYGLPKQIHTDNGSPFGSVPSIQRFTRLSYWFIDLGIMPVYSDPAHPEQNGRHERMHRDLKAECASPPAYDLRSQQRKLNKHFAVNEIIQYFLKDIDFETINPDTSIPALGNLRYFRDFAKLSSFIHCGPIAVDVWKESKKNNKTNETILNTDEYAFVISKSIKDLVLIALNKITKDKKFLEISEKINKIVLK